MLTDAQKTALKERLEGEKKLLEEELSRLGAKNPGTPGDWVTAKPEGEEFGADRTDNAGVIEEQFGNSASMQELEGRYNTVTRALEKFANGTYGVCEMSGHDIEPERLEANPAARTCMAHMHEEKTLG
jgi:RNA polymerase-binding transcription factor DksA